ncbi:MAG: acyl carrier protein [Xanthomonadales bacterium]|nr:acyl carrier protein [Gammaproteobacteria bacterium]MBT8052687.1 acyl carrier protein [Gammaproteobacteria bacterium]NND56792.1 acyl carrier protein [Xanthomonadales bacterium]NNK50655.1 acyl carrier protein [Xanthomonadales bacterium]
MNTRKNEIERRICELLASYLESSNHPELEAHGEITGDTNLASDFTLDSFQIMEFMMEIEESFDILIDVNSLSNSHTVSDLAEIVISSLDDTAG